MKKTIVALFLAVIMLLSLAACGQNETASSSETQTAEQPSASAGMDAAESVEESGWTGEVSHIIVTYDTLGVTPTDLDKVQAAVNARTVPEIGVEVEFKAVSAYDAFALFPTWIGTGERVDLMMPLLQDLRTYVDQGMILPLDSLIAENAPHLQALIEQFPSVTGNNIIDGETYAILSVPNLTGQGGGYIIGQQYVDEVDWDYDPARVYSFAELGELFALIKENHPDIYPCGVVMSGKTDSEYAYSHGAFDTLSGSPKHTGVLMGTDSTTFVNLYETEEYVEYLHYLREWYQAGYIHPDSATMDGSVTSLKDAGVTAGYFMVSAPVQRGENDYIIRLSEPYTASAGAGGWVIPITAEEPEAAIRFIDLVWSDSDLANLIQWGIEGEHYVMLDESIGYIGFPEGVDASTSGYYNTLGLWGDTRSIYIWTPTSSQADNDAYSAEAVQHKTQGIGISYSMANVTNEVAALSAVVAQYVPALESGSVDIDTYYPEFINALRTAGIDTVIADKQAQFDAQYGK